jgi:hypothetical protein
LKPFEKLHPDGNDTRSHSERAGDAFADVLRMAANCPDLPTQNGLKTEIALKRHNCPLPPGVTMPPT